MARRGPTQPGLPWDDEERAFALACETYEEFRHRYPDRGYHAWRIKKNRMLRGLAPQRGDGRTNDIKQQLDELRTAGLTTEPMVRRAPGRHPSGWEPGVAWDGKRGHVTTQPLAEPNPDWTSVLEHFGLDAAKYEVVEPVQMRTWDAAIGDGEVRQMWYYRADIRMRRGGDDKVDIDDLIATIKSFAPVERKRPTGGAFVVVLSDWQIGKKATAETVDRILAAIEHVKTRYLTLRSAGKQLDCLYVLAAGDVVEGCTGFYEMQEFTVELNSRDQRKIARRLISRALTTWATDFRKVVVAAVGGNHGENRKGGKAYTDFGDNADVEVVEQVAEILAANPQAFGHVSFVLPDDQLTVTLDVAGTILGLAHGHQAKSGPTPQAKLVGWWKGQGHGMRPVGDARVLVSGHFHQLLISEDGPRTLFIAPTMDSGSDWWEESMGVPSRSGMLTFVVDETGWHDVAVLR